MSDPAIKDPLPPEHRRFVLNMASLRLWLMALAVIALGVWVFVEF